MRIDRLGRAEWKGWSGIHYEMFAHYLSVGEYKNDFDEEIEVIYW